MPEKSNALITYIDEIAPILGYEPERLQNEIREYISSRITVLLRAADFANDEQIESYLAHLLEREARPEEVQLSYTSRRKMRLSTEERVQLESKQGDRCALCGRLLVSSASPHVDHIQPIAHGGTDRIENLQLLCSECNLGKQDLLSWHLGVPYQEKSPTKRLRYVVLARAGGACAVSTCSITSKEDTLQLVTRIPKSVGGRWVFDNLMAVCSNHLKRIENDRTSRTKRALSQRKSGGAIRINSN